MISTAPFNARELDARIRALAAEQCWPEVIAAVESVSADAPVSSATAAAAYKAHSAAGNAAAAEEWLDRALQLASDNSTLHRNKGVIHQRRGEWPQATACFEQAVALRPGVAAYRGSLATALFHTARYADAVEQYRAGLAIDPAQRAWWLRLARSLIHLNELNDAADAYAKALSLKDDHPTRSARDELLRQIRSGSRAASSAYYDAVFADSPKYNQHGESSEYAPIWQRIVEALRAGGTQRILDLGCGPGQFAEFLAAQLPAVEYTGVDFSGVAVSRGRQRCPRFLFERRELPIADFSGLPPFDTVICTEVLEHVERDREILAALPQGARIVASVPNFDAFGHLRLFRGTDEVRERYGALIEGLQVEGIVLSAQNTLWLMHGTRSAAPLAAEESSAPALGSIDLGACAVDAVLWTDGTRYTQDFLPLFGLPFVTVAESVGLEEPHVALRHDVDWSIENAYAMALVERQLGVRSSYYLLHPDAGITQKNYFGRVEDEQLVLDPKLFDWAARLLDLGHEVGLHNDLITLALATRRQPGEFLEQIVEAFTRRGMPLVGSVAHGSRKCREHGYMNYQIFEELQQVHVAVDYQDSTELFDRFHEPQVEVDDHVVPKFKLRMADYGLRYEANFVPWEIYISDSSARWSMWHRTDLQRLEKFAPREEMKAAAATLLQRKQPRSGVQCLVHACHWSVLSHANAHSVAAVRKHLKQRLGEARTRSMVERLHAFDNVVVARTDDRFQVYDQEYGTKPQLYKLTSTVSRFIDEFVERIEEFPCGVLEVGCGQGDLLATVVQRLQAKAGGRTIDALGVDGSPGAILTCCGRYPSLHWAADSLEHFLVTHDDIALDDAGRPRRYDLVLDKTGAIFIDSYEAACAYFARIDALMRPGARYVYIASRHYYDEVLSKKNYADWPRDWLAIAAATWTPEALHDDVAPALRGYLKRVFRKGAGNAGTHHLGGLGATV